MHYKFSKSKISRNIQILIKFIVACRKVNYSYPELFAISGAKINATMPYSTLDVCWYRHATLGINAIIAVN